MYNYDFALDMAEQNALNRKRNKKKLNELLDKYGESKEAIEQNADLKDSLFMSSIQKIGSQKKY